MPISRQNLPNDSANEEPLYILQAIKGKSLSFCSIEIACSSSKPVCYFQLRNSSEGRGFSIGDSKEITERRRSLPSLFQASNDTSRPSPRTFVLRHFRFLIRGVIVRRRTDARLRFYFEILLLQRSFDRKRTIRTL